MRRALVAGPRLPDPWVALATVRLNQDEDPAGAIRALRRALELGPSSSDAHDRAGRILLEADLWDEALALLDRALWLDPSQSWARIDRMRAAALSGDWAEAQRVYETGSGPLWEGHASIHRTRIWSWSGAPELALPEVPDNARPELRVMVLGYRAAREKRAAGEVPSRSEIESAMGPLIRVAPRGRSRRFGYQMLVEQAAIGGNHEAALEYVGSAVSEGLLDLCWMNRLTLLDPLRGDPTFEAHRRTVEERAASVALAWRGEPESFEEALASSTPVA